jgi:5'-nucleotidase
MTSPLILVTNDDGVESLGLWAAVEALAPLGEVWVVAPDRQWSGAGRAMLHDVTGALHEMTRTLDTGQTVRAYGVDATPALCIVHAMMELVPREPALLVSGINFGENVSTEITISGTVGAALEAAAFGVPAMAVSLEMPVDEHRTGAEATRYTVAQGITRRFAECLLATREGAPPLPFDVDVLSINVPRSVGEDTPWQLTRLSRRRYFVPLQPERESGEGRPGYTIMDRPEEAEPGSDVRALRRDRVVSVTPLSLDLTARAAFGTIEERLRTQWDELET